MSRANLEHFANAMVRIEARETLTRYHAAALASGNMRPAQARSALRRLERQAYGAERHVDDYRPKTRAERHTLLHAMGVTVSG